MVGSANFQCANLKKDFLVIFFFSQSFLKKDFWKKNLFSFFGKKNLKKDSFFNFSKKEFEKRFFFRLFEKIIWKKILFSTFLKKEFQNLFSLGEFSPTPVFDHVGDCLGVRRSLPSFQFHDRVYQFWVLSTLKNDDATVDLKFTLTIALTIALTRTPSCVLASLTSVASAIIRLRSWNFSNRIQSDFTFHCLTLTSCWWSLSVEPESSHWKPDIWPKFSLYDF